MIKYEENEFMEKKIKLIKEMEDMCENVGRDVRKIEIGIGIEKRIGERLINEGNGYGG